MSELEFSPEELVAIRKEYAPQATDEQFTLFISECKRRGLTPGRHVIFQTRRSQEYDATVGAKVWVQKPYWITTIAALRLVAERTGKYIGQTPAEFIYLDDEGNPTVISQIPLPQKGNPQAPREPWAVRVGIKRRDFPEPIIGLARFDAVAGTVKTQDGGYVLSSMWQKRGPEQAQKCAEADGIRRCFSEETGSLYLQEELKFEDETPTETPITVTPASVVPVPPVAPKVNQTPAEATETPRPGEKEPGWDTPSGGRVTVAQALDQEKRLQEGISKAKEESPDPKPAAENKKKGGRPSKVKSPNNGQPPVEGITDADIPKPGETLPEPVAVDKAEVEEFVESLDPTPTKEEQAGFTARVRALAAAGALNSDLKNYILNVGKKSDPKQLTVSNWKTALDQLEAIAESKEKLKEVTKNAPLPSF